MQDSRTHSALTRAVSSLALSLMAVFLHSFGLQIAAGIAPADKTAALPATMSFQLHPPWRMLQSGPLKKIGIEDAATSMTYVEECPAALFDFHTWRNHLAISNDSGQAITSIYMLDEISWLVTRHDVDSTFGHDTVALPIHGDPRVANDLDRDGEIEVITQVGDMLQVYSAPGWGQRGVFSFPGKSVIMYPEPVQCDADSELEVFVTATDLPGNATAVLLDYSANTGGFYIAAQLPAPPGTAGPIAAGDLDDDGNAEFITGGFYGYSLFEWRDTALALVGPIGPQDLGNSHHASVVHPIADGRSYVLAGYSSPNTGLYRYVIYAASGDNTFDSAFVISSQTAYTGIHPSRGSDVDCDGMAELALFVPPIWQIWEWNPNAASFINTCSYTGTVIDWYETDFDQNGRVEWSALQEGVLLPYPSDTCISCDPQGHCLAPMPCECVCAGDPNCDGTRSDIVDVILTIDVAFRGAGPIADPSATCLFDPTDLDCDRSTSVLDVVHAIEIAFRAGDPSSTLCDRCPW